MSQGPGGPRQERSPPVPCKRLMVLPRLSQRSTSVAAVVSQRQAEHRGEGVLIIVAVQRAARLVEEHAHTASNRPNVVIRHQGSQECTERSARPAMLKRQ